MARIRQRGKRWHVSFRDPVTKEERSAGTYGTKGQAVKQLKAVEYQLESGEWIDPKLQATPYGEWVQEWFAAQVVRQGTRETNASALNAHILPTFGEARLRDIRPIHVEQFIADLSTSGLSASRIRSIYGVLNRSLRAAVNNEMLRSNPAEGIKLPKQTTRDMLFVGPDQVKALANEVGDEYAALVYVLAYGGLRIGEARALRRSSINLMRGTIEVRESVTYRGGGFVFTPPKNGKNRVVTIPGFLGTMLEEHLHDFTGTQPNALVFPGTGNNPFRLYRFRRDVWTPALERAGIVPEFRIHDLRHTTASILINQGLHPKVVQEHLGHGSIAITMDRYGHLYDSENQRLADALDAAFSTGLVVSDTPTPIGGGEPAADTTRTNDLKRSEPESRKSAVAHAGQGI